MKTALCYGDSITWGFNPVDGSRFPFEQRWPGVLQAELGSGFRVIEEGLNGRTVATESWILPNRDGRSMLAPLLESHAPLDWVILLLGTNDCGPTYRRDVGEIAFGCATLLWTVQKASAGPNGGCRTRSSSHPRRSGSSRRSWSFSFAAAKPPAADWRQRTAPLPKHPARVFSTPRVLSRPVRSMACIRTRTASAGSAKRSRRS
ncbi:MAG: GDSL-type esterase/lipase family protein [Burkholderiales bacterium]